MKYKRNTRTLAGLALLTLVAIFAAATSLHQHDNSTRDACRLCQVGHMPALQTAASATVLAPVLLGWQAPAIVFYRDFECVLGTGPSRAPPSA
jgi:hypothetical protein